MGDLVKLDAAVMTDEQIDLNINQLLHAKTQRLEQKLMELTDSYKKLQSQIGLYGDELEKTKSMVVAKMKVTEPKFGYVGLGDFGRYIGVSIGAKNMGKILRIVGLAMPSRGATTPYRWAIPKYAQTEAHENYTATRWHYQNCMEYIDEHLKQHGLYERFYSISTEREMEQFIAEIYKQCAG